MWYDDIFEPKKYYASVQFYRNGGFGFMYRGNIYDDKSNIIGNYRTNDSFWIENNFII